MYVGELSVYILGALSTKNELDTQLIMYYKANVVDFNNLLSFFLSYHVFYESSNIKSLQVIFYLWLKTECWEKIS